MENVEIAIQEQFTAPPGGGATCTATMDTDMTGRLVWPTAAPLLERVKREYASSIDDETCKSRVGRIPVLELGSGCGLLGMGLAATGCFDVTLTDNTDQSVDWLKGNVEINRDVIGDHHVKVARLSWGNQQDAAELEEATRINNTPFELIVGSDIIYDHSSHAALVATMKQFALPANARVLLAYPARQDEDAFLSVAKEYFEVTVAAIDMEGVNSTRSSKRYSVAFLSLKRVDMMKL
jgi:predicted nicotinamide N-methyase